MPERTEYKKTLIAVIATFVMATLVVCGFVVVSQMTNLAKSSEVSNLQSIINQSGRQRMYSQRMTLLAHQSITDTTINAQLRFILSNFSKSHKELSRFNSQLENVVIDSLFNALEPSYASILTYTDDILTEDSISLDNIHELRRASDEFLVIMDETVNHYEEIGKNLQQAYQSEKWSNTLLTLVAVLIGAGGALIVTLQVIKKYQLSIIDKNLQLESLVATSTRNNEKLNFLIDSINVGVWERDLVDEQENWSGTFYRLLGFSKGEVPGTGEYFQQLVHPTDREVLVNAADEAIKSGKPSTIEIRIKTKSGTYRWFEATGNVKRSEQGQVELLIGGIIDIHDRKKLENQLKVFTDRAPAAIAMFDLDMRYILASDEWIKTYNLKGREIIGKSHYDIFPEIGEEWKKIHRAALDGQVNESNEAPFPRADGTTQWIKWEVRPWYVSEQEIGGIIMFTEDVSENKEQKDALREARKEAENASEAKAEFLATMSHEIRTPLNAINGITNLMLMENPRKDQVDHLNLLKFSGETLLNLINDILDMSKIQAGKLELSPVPLELNTLVENIYQTLKPKAEEKLITLEINIDPKVPSRVLGDVKRISQVLFNLLGNAIKFTEKGRVILIIKHLSYYNQYHTVHFEVKDTGIGIPQDAQQRIFNSFEQEDAGITRNYGGSGLGLFITTKLLGLMGSQIHLQSKPGLGSSFAFKLSLKETAEIPVTSGHYAKGKKPDFNNRGLKVLVAEDNISNRLILKNFLEIAGIESVYVENGQLAVKELEENPVFDLVFMDLRMPVMDGFTASKEIRNLKGEYFQRIPIIALTADAFSEVKHKTKAAGMNDYLSKPFQPTELYAVIESNSDLNTLGSSTAKLHDQDEFSKEAIQSSLLNYGDESTVLEIAQLTIPVFQEFIQNLDQAFSSLDEALWFEATHKIKSSALYMGLTKV